MKKKKKLPAYRKGGKIRKAKLGDPIGGTEEDPMVTDGSNQTPQSPLNGLGVDQTADALGLSMPQPPEFNPALTRSLDTYNKVNNKSSNPTLSPEEKTQYDRYNARRDRPSQAWQLGYYPGLAAQFSNNAKEDKEFASYANDPTIAKGYEKRSRINQMGAGAAGFQAGLNGIKGVLGALSSAHSYSQGKLAEAESFSLHNRERAEMKPYRGRDDAPAFVKFGGRLPIAMHGADPVDFSNAPYNIEDEVGEAVGVPPMRHPITGEVSPGAVFEEDGKSHAEGGNKRGFPGGTGILTKRLGMTKNQAVRAFGGTTEVASRIASSDKDELSFADMGGLYNTEALSKEHEALDKDLNKTMVKVKKVGERQNLGETKVAQATDKISTATLKKRAEVLAVQQDMVEQEMAYNSNVVRKVILPTQEGMKSKGKYGKNIKEDGKAAYGKKIKLPKAGPGDEVDPTDEERITDLRAKAVHNDPFLGGFYAKQIAASGETEAQPVEPVQGPLNMPPLYDFGTGNTPSTTPPVTPSTYSYLKGPGRFVEKPGSVTKDTRYPIGRNQINDVEYKNREFEENEAAKKAGLASIPEITDTEAKELGIDLKTTSSDQIADARIQNYHYNRLMQTPEGQEALLREWTLKGRTKKGDRLGLPPMTGDLTKLKNPEERLAYLKSHRADFVDTKVTDRWGRVSAPMAGDTGPAEVAVKRGDDAIGETPRASLDLRRKRGSYYQEGLHPWQIAGEFATLFDPYEPAPYIEDHGAADALAASNRPQFVSDQSQQNRITRGLRALTRNNPQDPSANAQYASNAWTAANESTADTAAKNAAIQDRYQEQQNQLRMAAGANKAKALDTLAVRTAKGHSAWTDRRINALSLIGNKEVHNLAENRAALLYQDMFPDFAYNPWSGSTFTGHTSLTAPGLDLRDKSAAQLRVEKARADADRAELEYYRTMEKKKMGGPVKSRLPKKSVKRVK